MEASLVTLAKTIEPESHPPLRLSSQSYQNTVLGLAYAALILSVGSIMSALKVVNGLGQINYWNAVEQPEPAPTWTRIGPADLMKTYGVKGSIRFSMWHCESLSVFLCVHSSKRLNSRCVQPLGRRFVRSHTINYVYMAARSDVSEYSRLGSNYNRGSPSIRHGLLVVTCADRYSLYKRH